MRGPRSGSLRPVTMPGLPGGDARPRACTGGVPRHASHRRPVRRWASISPGAPRRARRAARGVARGPRAEAHPPSCGREARRRCVPRALHERRAVQTRLACRTQEGILRPAFVKHDAPRALHGKRAMPPRLAQHVQKSVLRLAFVKRDATALFTGGAMLTRQLLAYHVQEGILRSAFGKRDTTALPTGGAMRTLGLLAYRTQKGVRRLECVKHDAPALSTGGAPC